MSHASGEIWTLEGSLRAYFEYNGTCDVVCTRVHNTYNGMWAEWRKDNLRNCSCSAEGQSVILYTDYGGGFYWPGKVCWNCMAITHGKQPWECEWRRDGRPFPLVQQVQGGVA